jgi:hypothetical protein
MQYFCTGNGSIEPSLWVGRLAVRNILIFTCYVGTVSEGDSRASLPIHKTDCTPAFWDEPLGTGFDQQESHGSNFTAQPTFQTMDPFSSNFMVPTVSQSMDPFSSNFNESFGSNFTVQPMDDYSVQPTVGSNFTAQPMESFGSNFTVQPMDSFGSNFNESFGSNFTAQPRESFGSNFTAQPMVGCSVQPTVSPTSSYMDMLGDSITITQPQVRWI